MELYDKVICLNIAKMIIIIDHCAHYYGEMMVNYTILGVLPHNDHFAPFPGVFPQMRVGVLPQVWGKTPTLTFFNILL